MGKIIQIHKGKDPGKIEAFLAMHKGKVKMSISLLITEDGSGHVWYSVSDKSDFILALGELELMRDYLIRGFYDRN